MARISEQEKREAAEVRILPAAYAEEFDAHFREETDDEKEFKKFFDEMQQSNDYAKIGVYRVPTDASGRPRGKQLAFMFEVSVGELTYTQLCSRVRDEYGSGIFRFQIRDEENKFVKSKTITIEAPKDSEPPNTTANMVQQISNAMQQQQQQIEDMLSRNRGPGLDIKAILSYALPIATALAALGISFKREAPKTLVDQLTEIKLLKDIFTGEGEGGESNLFSLLEKTVTSFGPAFAQAVAMGRERGQMDASGQIRLPHLSAPQKSVQPENDAMQMQVESMRPQLEMIVKQAKIGLPAEMVAEFFVDNIDKNDKITDEQIIAINDFLQLPDCFQRCVAVVPDLETYATWFDVWRDAMLNGLTALFDDDDETLSSDLTADATDADHAASTVDASAHDAGQPSPSDVNGNSERRAGDAGNAAHHVEHGETMEKERTVASTDLIRDRGNAGK